MKVAPWIVLLALQEPKHFDPAVHEATKTFAYEDFLIVPVRVHVLQSKADDTLHCRLEEKDVRRIFGKINRIWNMAGIALRIESVLKEDALTPDGFDGSKAPAEEFRKTRPAETRPAGMIHVYYIHRLTMNGIYLGGDAIFVKDTAALREVKGGVDEPIPRVTSHEMGHAFSLPHRQDTINLMASGTTGWSLNDAEAAAARAWASKQPWVLTPAQAFEKKQFDILADLPGESGLKAKAREALGQK